jgi:hypothetical protein
MGEGGLMEDQGKETKTKKTKEIKEAVESLIGPAEWKTFTWDLGKYEPKGTMMSTPFLTDYEYYITTYGICTSGSGLGAEDFETDDDRATPVSARVAISLGARDAIKGHNLKTCGQLNEEVNSLLQGWKEKKEEL